MVGGIGETSVPYAFAFGTQFYPYGEPPKTIQGAAERAHRGADEGYRERVRQERDRDCWFGRAGDCWGGVTGEEFLWVNVEVVFWCGLLSCYSGTKL